MPSDRSGVRRAPHGVAPTVAHAHPATRRRRTQITRRSTRVGDQHPLDGERLEPSAPALPTRRRAPGGLPAAGPIVEVIVAVPARNEADYIGACLVAIDASARRCRVPVSIVVAADSCHDDTAAIARAAPMRHARVDVIEAHWHGAGRTRAAAVAAALAGAADDLSQVWIANTDADCLADPSWLPRQLREARRGIHAVAGVVTLDPHATPEPLLAQFTATYHVRGATHHHVHGANFGVRADAYRLVGGWSTHTVVGEDHELWRRLTAARLELRQPSDISVTTSSRTTGRVAGGFASRLSRLERDRSRHARSAS